MRCKTSQMTTISHRISLTIHLPNATQVEPPVVETLLLELLVFQDKTGAESTLVLTQHLALRPLALPGIRGQPEGHGSNSESLVLKQTLPKSLALIGLLGMSAKHCDVSSKNQQKRLS